MIDLAPLLPDPPAAQEHPEFPGTPLPALAHARLERRLQPECRSCPKAAADHLSWGGHGPIATPTSTRRAAQQEAIGTVNAILERRFRQQSLVQLMDRWVNGIYTDAGADIQVSSQFIWPVASMSGNRVTCRLDESTELPSQLHWVTIARDPYTAATSISHHYGKLPARGILTFQNTIGGERRRFVVRRILGGDAGYGGSFSFEFEGSIGPADAIHPGQPGAQINAVYSVYLEQAEPWLKPRRVFPFWGKRRTVAIEAGDFSPAYALKNGAGADTRIYYPANRPEATRRQYFSVTGFYEGGAVEDETSRVPVRIEHTLTGYRTILDMSDLMMEASLARVAVTYWHESSDEDAIWLGQDRCRWSTEDPTGSWGTAEAGTTSTFYCARPFGTPDPASFRAGHRPACSQTACSGWETDVFTSPFDRNLVRQIVYGERGVTWVVQQAMPGGREWFSSLLGPPALATLAGLDLDLPDGFHALKVFPQNGGWERGMVTGDILHRVRGFETLVDDPAATWAWNNLNTWPKYGPAGNTWARRREIGNSLEDDTTVPGFIRRSIALAAGVAIHPYELLVIDGLGTAVRCGVRTQHLVLPRLESPAERPDGTFRRAFMDADFNRQLNLNQGTPTVYGAFADVSQLRLDREWSSPLLGPVRREWMDPRTASVFKASYDLATRRLLLELDNALETCSTFEWVGRERQTCWRQGGGHVEPAEVRKNRNWASTFCVGVDETKLKPGMVAELPEAMMTVFGADPALREVPRRFAIVEAEAFAGTTDQSVIPGDIGGPRYKLRDDLPGMPEGGIFIPFEAVPASETIFRPVPGSSPVQYTTSIAATLDELPLTPVALWDAGPPRKYFDPAAGQTAEMPEDSIAVVEGSRLVQVGNDWVSQRGFRIIFSQKNMRQDTSSERFLVRVETFDAASNYAHAGVYDNGQAAYYTYDQNYLAGSAWSVAGIEGVTSLDSVEILLGTLDASGRPVRRPLTLHNALPPAPHLWPGVDHCYWQPGATIGDYRFWTHSFYAGSTARVNFTPTYAGLSDEQWVETQIRFHGERGAGGSLARDWERFYRRGDVIVLQDEGDILKRIWDASGPEFWEHQELAFHRDLIAHPVDPDHEPTLTLALRNSKLPDQPLVRGVDYEFFGAAGRLFLSRALTAGITRDHCLALVAHLADLRGQPLLAEEQAITRIFENLLEVNGAWGSIRPVFDQAYMGTQESTINMARDVGADYETLTDGGWVPADYGVAGLDPIASYAFGARLSSAPLPFPTNPAFVGVFAPGLGGATLRYPRGAWCVPLFEAMKPRPDDILEARANVLLSGLMHRTTTVHHYWSATNDYPTFINIQDQNTWEWYQERAEITEETTNVGGKLALAAVIPNAQGELRPVIVADADLAGAWNDGQWLAYDLTSIVKAYLTWLAAGAIGFQMLFLGGEGYALSPEKAGTDAALVDVFHSYTNGGPGYTHGVRYCFVQDGGNDWYGQIAAFPSGTSIAHEYYFGGISFGPINVRLRNLANLDARARVFYGVPPAAPPQ